MDWRRIQTYIQTSEFGGVVVQSGVVVVDEGGSNIVSRHD